MAWRFAGHYFFVILCPLFRFANTIIFFIMTKSDYEQEGEMSPQEMKAYAGQQANFFNIILRVSKNDQGMFSQCREIAMKVAEELGNASLQRE